MLPADKTVDWADEFGRQAPLMLEIGFGTGSALLAFAEAHPHVDCIGMEVYQPGIGNALQEIRNRSLKNLRLMECDARGAVNMVFEPRSLSSIHIYFPDPWPKKRHHKRRLVNRDFVELLASRLNIGGQLKLATDNAHYAEAMLSHCDAEPCLKNQAGAGNFAKDSDGRPSTRFECRGQTLGNETFNLAYVRTSQELPHD